ncbi:MAG: phage protein Gp27 family protein [Dysosmobacter welbionis]
MTYQEIADTLTGQGYEISRSAVGRYAMRHNSAARRLKKRGNRRPPCCSKFVRTRT